MFKEKDFPPGALSIIKTLNNKGFRCYLVGGCIRDLLMKNKPQEWDLTTDALPRDIQGLFDKVVPTGIEYGTVTIILSDGYYEVTTFRADERYVDGRHPENVRFTKNLEEDLKRRDFTVNAMAYNPFTSEFIDLFNGKKDLKDKIIKTVGDPVKRFSEDGLRPIRACRFAAQLKFEIEKNTFKAISQSLNIIRKVAPERVKDEVVKILKTDKPSMAFELMRQSGILDIFIPELSDCFEVEQPPKFHKYDVYWHSLYSCDAAPKDNLVVRLASLLHDIAKPICKKEYTFYNHDRVGKEMTEKILKRLRFSNEIIARVSVLIINHMFDYRDEWKDATVRRFIRRIGVENLDDLFLLRIADTKAMEREIDNKYLSKLKKRINKVLDEEAALHIKDLKIDGSDVMEVLNISPSPKVGEILNYLIEKVLDDPSLNTREKLIEIIKKHGKK